jgi:EAL domain-containing protein (putative c-di-GMP-specific phosphodiesterase class I)
MDLRYLTPVGAEALLRWRHPDLGWVAPPELITVAEAVGRDRELFTWVLHSACRQLSMWAHDGRDLWLSINVSGRQLVAESSVADVAAALESHAVTAERLVIEVAEADLTGDSPAAERLTALRALGVRTALDRFGTGPTTLAHLRRLPVDLLKVDRAVFTGPGGATGPATPIVDVVVILGERLGIEVIALGLGDAADVDLVRAAGCRTGQGFALAAPTHAEHLEAFLDQHRAPRL